MFLKQKKTKNGERNGEAIGRLSRNIDAYTDALRLLDAQNGEFDSIEMHRGGSFGRYLMFRNSRESARINGLDTDLVDQIAGAIKSAIQEQRRRDRSKLASFTQDLLDNT